MIARCWPYLHKCRRACFSCRDLPLGNETEFEVGDRVQARWNGEPTYYVGTLTSVNPYAIDYDDGDHEDDVDASFIRASRLPDPPRYPTPDAAPPTCSTVLEGRDVGALCDAACFVSNDIFAAKGEDCWCGEATLKLHGKVRAVASASKHVACACADGAVRILKVETDIVLLHSLRNPIDKVQFSSPSFGAGGEHLAPRRTSGRRSNFTCGRSRAATVWRGRATTTRTRRTAGQFKHSRATRTGP